VISCRVVAQRAVSPGLPSPRQAVAAPASPAIGVEERHARAGSRGPPGDLPLLSHGSLAGDSTGPALRAESTSSALVGRRHLLRRPWGTLGKTAALGQDRHCRQSRMPSPYGATIPKARGAQLRSLTSRRPPFRFRRPPRSGRVLRDTVIARHRCPREGPAAPLLSRRSRGADEPVRGMGLVSVRAQRRVLLV
jgi:hypothetical protein